MVMILGMNGIAVARNGPILWENEATGSRKVFKYLLDLWDTIKKQKMLQKSRNSKILCFLYNPYIDRCGAIAY